MSTTLTWAPVTSAGGTLPYELKKTISRKLWNTDGSYGDGYVEVDSGLVPYLEGLRDAGIPGAEELIELIERYGTVTLWHQG